MKHVPDSVYAKLPHLYVIGGLGAVLFIDHPAAVASGVLLVVAGLSVFNYRLTHRIKKKDMGAFGRCEMAHTCERRQALLDRRGVDRRAAEDQRKAEERRMTERRNAAIDRRSR